MTTAFPADALRTLPTTITYLEMSARPARPPRPAPVGKVALLRAERPPQSFYLWLYRNVGRDWNWTDRLVWPQDRLLDVIHHPAVEIIVCHVGGVPAGFAELDFRRPGTSELALFGFLPEYQGKGYGGYFLDHVIDAMWRPGIDLALVDTNVRDHPRALVMYQKAGFRVVRREEAWLIPDSHFRGAFDLPQSAEAFNPQGGKERAG